MPARWSSFTSGRGDWSSRPDPRRPLINSNRLAHAEADAPRSRCVLDPGGERMANARIMGWPPLPRCRAVRGYRADRRARPVRHDFLRRWQRHSQHLGRGHRCGGASGRGVAAARHEPVDHGDVAGHAACRLWADLRVDVHAPVLRRASFELARSHHGWAHCLQCHLVAAAVRL